MSSRFEFLPTPLPGVAVVQRKPLVDERGFLARVWCAEEFRDAGHGFSVAQINHSLTRRRGTVRGMHFQRPPAAEIKLVSCVRGEVFDVALDLRRGSPTFLCWHGELLSAANQRSLLLPEGVAHGFQALVEDCELVYLHSVAYQPEAEGGVNPRDPRIGIAWPQAVAELSPRDAAHPLLAAGYTGIAP